MTERRRSRRCRPGGFLCIRLLPLASHRSAAAVVDDLSAGGTSLLAARRLRPGEEVWLEWLGGDLLRAEVVHATANHDGTWSLGCRFTSQLAPAALQDLLP